MWLFGKKLNIGSLLKDDEAEEPARGEEDLSFAPEIVTERPDPAGRTKKDAAARVPAKKTPRAEDERAQSGEEPASDASDDLFDAEATAKLFGNVDIFDDLPGGRETVGETPDPIPGEPGENDGDEEDLADLMRLDGAEESDDDDDIYEALDALGIFGTPSAKASQKEEKNEPEACKEESGKEAPAPAADDAEDAAPQNGEEESKRPAGKSEPEYGPFAVDLFPETKENEEANDELSRLIAGIVSKDSAEEQTLVLPAEEFFSLFEEKGSSAGDEETPEDVFERLKETPYTARTYALYKDEIYLSCSDGEGGMYLFEEFGEYRRVAPGECKAFIKLPHFEGSFRGNTHKTADFEYIMEQHAMKLCAVAHTKEEQEALRLDGYLPEKPVEGVKGRIYGKSVSLYRMKDLAVRADVTMTFPVLMGESYFIEVQRADLEEIDCEKQFRRFCRRIIDFILGAEEEPFFTVQVLKVRRNLVVCFPLEGVPAEGDRFAGGEIAAAASLDDGTCILQIGQEEKVKLPLTENHTERGQHRLSLV